MLRRSGGSAGPTAGNIVREEGCKPPYGWEAVDVLGRRCVRRWREFGVQIQYEIFFLLAKSDSEPK